MLGIPDRTHRRRRPQTSISSPYSAKMAPATLPLQPGVHNMAVWYNHRPMDQVFYVEQECLCRHQRALLDIMSLVPIQRDD